MEKFNATSKNRTEGTSDHVVREYDIGGKDYIVRSIFIGDKDVKTVLLNLAEQKAIKDMGLDCAII